MLGLLKNGKLNTPTILLALSMFFTGASGFIVQNILSVTTSSILGNTFVQFAITTSLMLGSMGLGGTLQKYIKSSLLSKFVQIELILALLTGFAPISLYFTYAIMPEHFVLIQYLWIICIGLLIGFEIPLITRINEKYQNDLSENMASIVTMDYIGSMIGGLLWAFVFLGNFDLSTSAFVTALINVIVAIITFVYFAKKEKHKFNKILIGSIIGVLLLITIAPFYTTKWRIDLQQYLYDDNIVINKTTKYQNLVLTHNRQLNDYRLFINGNLQFSTLDEKIYHENLIHPVMALKSKPENVLVLGGGDGMAVRELLKYKSVNNITLVDLDDGMIDLFKNNPILTKLNDSSFYDSRVRSGIGNITKSDLTKNIFVDSRPNKYSKKIEHNKIASVNVFTMDAYNFVNEFDDIMYDVIIIDFPDPSIIELNKLYTSEFYGYIKGLLESDGMISIQSTSPYHAKEAFLCIGRTMNSVGLKTLPFHDNVPTFGDWGWYLSWKDNRTITDITNEIDNLKKFDVDDISYLTVDRFRSNLVFGHNNLKTDNNDVNSLMNPVLIHYYGRLGWRIQ